MEEAAAVVKLKEAPVHLNACRIGKLRDFDHIRYEKAKRTTDKFSQTTFLALAFLFSKPKQQLRR